MDGDGRGTGVRLLEIVRGCCRWEVVGPAAAGLRAGVAFFRRALPIRAVATLDLLTTALRLRLRVTLP